jgi:hypothetical protein
MLPALRSLLQLPRGQQFDAVNALREQLGAGEPEEWNTTFGPGSLFEAWTASVVAQGAYAANRPLLPTRGRVVEVGGGDGRLWTEVGFEGELTLFDPVEGAHEQVRRAVPALVSRVEPVGLDIPSCDLLVCSMTLHHVAGRTAAERARWGMQGPGKVEILRAMGRAADRIVLNEASIHCELDLAPGDPVLRDNMMDSYIRRCGHALLDQIEANPDSPFVARWRHIIHRWCLDQVAMAEVSRAERDVYELDVPRWLECFEQAGLRVLSRKCTDDYGLFWQYVLTRDDGSR